MFPTSTDCHIPFEKQGKDGVFQKDIILYIYIPHCICNKQTKKQFSTRNPTHQQNVFKTKIPTKSGFTKSPARNPCTPHHLQLGAPWIQLGTRSWPEVEDGKGPRRSMRFLDLFPRKKNLGSSKQISSWKTAVAVNFHQYKLLKTATVASKNGTLLCFPGLQKKCVFVECCPCLVSF